MFVYFYIFTITVVSVKFIVSSYSVGEMSMAVFMLMLSSKSSTEIALIVSYKDVTATGSYILLYDIHSNYIMV